MSLLRLLTLALCVPLCYSAAALSSADVVDKTKPDVETTLDTADFEATHHDVEITKLGIRVKDDPTMGRHMEGDIALDNIKQFVDQNNKLGRNAIRNAYRRWPNGEIPYTLSSQYGSYARSVIAKAFQEYHTKTCVRFVPRDPAKHADYIYIHPDDGCYSLVGKTGGRQPLSLDSGCIQVGTIVHELMHAVGFFHEQSRADRDDYLDIQWRNVMNGADDQFEKYILTVIDHLGEPYDYASIMHYGPYAFSGNGKKTLNPKKSGAERMGQRVEFSPVDVRKINKLYNCPAAGGVGGNSILESTATVQSSQTQVHAHGIPSSLPLPPPSPAETELPHASSHHIKATETVAGSASKTCDDDNWRCPYWNIYKACEQYKEVRIVICRKTCGTCTVDL